jgi:hypothetical protein
VGLLRGHRSGKEQRRGYTFRHGTRIISEKRKPCTPFCRCQQNETLCDRSSVYTRIHGIPTVFRILLAVQRSVGRSDHSAGGQLPARSTLAVYERSFEFP